MVDVKRRCILLAITVVLAGTGMGCGPPVRPPGPPRPEFELGKADMEAYLRQEMRLYRLVIKPQAMDRPAQEAYVKGVQSVFQTANDGTHAEQIGKALLEAARGPEFNAALDLGERHLANEVTNARIQSLIGGSLNRGLGVELGWKAGYAEGFRRALEKERPRVDIEELYDEAQAVYDALRSSL